MDIRGGVGMVFNVVNSCLFVNGKEVMSFNKPFVKIVDRRVKKASLTKMKRDLTCYGINNGKRLSRIGIPINGDFVGYLYTSWKMGYKCHGIFRTKKISNSFLTRVRVLDEFCRRIKSYDMYYDLVLNIIRKIYFSHNFDVLLTDMKFIKEDLDGELNVILEKFNFKLNDTRFRFLLFKYDGIPLRLLDWRVFDHIDLGRDTDFDFSLFDESIERVLVLMSNNNFYSSFIAKNLCRDGFKSLPVVLFLY